LLPAHLAFGFNSKYGADFSTQARVPSGPIKGAPMFAPAAAHQGCSGAAEKGLIPET